MGVSFICKHPASAGELAAFHPLSGRWKGGPTVHGVAKKGRGLPGLECGQAMAGELSEPWPKVECQCRLAGALTPEVLTDAVKPSTRELIIKLAGPIRGVKVKSFIGIGDGRTIGQGKKGGISNECQFVECFRVCCPEAQVTGGGSRSSARTHTPPDNWKPKPPPRAPVVLAHHVSAQLRVVKRARAFVL